MTQRSSRHSGLPPTDYYAPNYKIEVEGQELDPETKGDLLEVKVVMEIENLTNFELNINNWDDRTLSFKYSDTRTFDVGNRVHVQMGYADRLRSMVIGQITTLAPKFPESGPPTIAVSGLDARLKLRDRKPREGEQKKFENMADWEMAQVIATRNGLRAEVTQEGEKREIVFQKNQDDAQFLMERASRSDRDFYVATDAESGDDTLFFIKPPDGRQGTQTRVYVFEWGKTLREFTPKLTLSRQVQKVTVRGWNPRTKAAFVATAGPEDLPGAEGQGTSGPQAAQGSLQDKEEAFVDAPVTSQEEAKELAVSLLTERAYEFITGSGQVIGLPDMRPGDNVEMQGLGKRFSGLYYVKKVEHTLGDSGYSTRFDVRRVYDGGVE